MKYTLAFCGIKSAHNNQHKWCWKMVAPPPGGGVERGVKIVAVALGSGGSRRTCNNGFSISVIEAEG
jgi:hypothetical protein